MVIVGTAILAPYALYPVAADLAVACPVAVNGGLAATEIVVSGAVTGATGAATTTALTTGAGAIIVEGGVTAGVTNVLTTVTGGAIQGAISSAPTASSMLVSLGPVGWVTLGATGVAAASPTVVTFDCWKPVLHDTSTEPSAGRLIKDVLADKRVMRFEFDGAGVKDWSIRAWNVFGETFEIVPIVLNGHTYAHANQI